MTHKGSRTIRASRQYSTPLPYFPRRVKVRYTCAPAVGPSASLGMARPADGLPLALQEAVLGESESMPEGSETVRGYDFNSGCDMNALMASFMQTGFQATNLALAIAEVRKMRAWRLSECCY